MILNIYNFIDGNKIYFFDNKVEHVLLRPEENFDCNNSNFIKSFKIKEIRIKKIKITYNEWIRTLKN